jgi:hypothetical protein
MVTFDTRREQMNLSAISAGGSDWQTRMFGALQQRNGDVDALGATLGSNDLPGAQRAFASLLADRQKLQGLRSSQGVPSTTTKPVVDDLQSLQNALKAGDLSSAKSDFAKLLTDIQQAQQHRHRHVGHGGKHGAATDASSSLFADDGDADDAASGAASILSGIDLQV